MSGGIGGFLAILFLLGLPIVAGGLLQSINKKIWLWRLSKRIGTVPEAVFFSTGVESGWRPSGIILSLCFPAGIGLLILANTLKSTGLRVIGALLFGLPMVVVLGLFLRYSFRNMSPGARTDRADLEKEEHRMHLEQLNQDLGQKQGDEKPPHEYLLGWRAGHLAAIACAEWNSGQQFNEEYVLQAEKDLNEVLDRSHDADLKRTARVLKWNLNRLRTMAVRKLSEAASKDQE